MADSGTDWLGFFGLLGAAGLASAAAVYNNRQQAKLQKETNDTAINLANTAHQREVEDLRAAGLNPILSASGSGAATPSLGTAQLDNVMESFGSNARGISDTLSKQRSLSNRSFQIDNEIQSFVRDRSRETLSSDVQSANAENRKNIQLADYERQLFEDKRDALMSYKYKNWDAYKFGLNDVLLPNPGYRDDVKDSVKAEVKESGTKYLQGWSNNIRDWANTGIDAVNSATGIGKLKKMPNRGVGRK